MARIFISYCHVKPDEDLARALKTHFAEAGFDVFLDTQIQTGLDWVKEIERQIQQASHFVVLLSSESILSQMVREETRLAQKLRSEGSLSILPVRVAFDGQLPYDLGAYLNSIQWDHWQASESFQALGVRLAQAIKSTQPPGTQMQSASTPIRAPDHFRETTGAPLPAADPRIVMETGTVRLNSPFYIRRREDEVVETAVCDNGVTCVIKGVRQSGKSSLLARVRAIAKQQDLPCGYIDLQNLDANQMSSLNSVLRAMAQALIEQFGVRLHSDDIWDETQPKIAFKRFLERVVLRGAATPVVLCLDEVDRVFDCDYRDDFFLTLRGWHNERAMSEPWERLNLFLAHATDPVLWIRDLNTSPFNVGERIRLNGFDIGEMAELNARHGTPIRDDKDLEQIRRLTGGQPYLVRRAIYELKRQGWSSSQLDVLSIDERGPFGDHLRARLWTLRHAPELCIAFRDILRLGACRDEFDFQRLEAAGLVGGESHARARASCELYYRYFEGHL